MSSTNSYAPLAAKAEGAVCEPTTLQAINLGYEINGKTILTDVNATFEPHKLTAVMGACLECFRQPVPLAHGAGPSGAGKTTMLNTLAMRAGGSRTGEIVVNGASLLFGDLTTSTLRPVCRSSAVHVEDAQASVVHATRRHSLHAVDGSTMLVRSHCDKHDACAHDANLRHRYYAAMLRVPDEEYETDRQRSHARKLARADNIMKTLGMSHVADNYMFEVSGGQRKRASAALEFLSDRPLLFMDGAHHCASIDV